MLNWPPGAIGPEFQALVSDVLVCVTLSVFIHVTVPPRCTMTGFGLYAVLVNALPPAAIDTDAADDDDEEGVGLAGELLPHAATKSRMTPQMTWRMVPPWTCYRGQTCCRG